ncbi:MAG: hypothetical protein A3G23_04425 [Bacteroidetes bacterium RIFCSPLOWO2_12_FULL_37_12]|nr:MAG: hypothetical protein A3G23_04425 [Bacteroidetes bacterium RIFCSPLOWO2_12_FULL_37_12]
MILITGGTGLVGTFLIRKLLEGNEKIRALKRKDSVLPSFDNSKGLLEWVEGDILDLGFLSSVFDSVEKVYHSAAVVGFLPSQRKDMYKVNIGGTANIVNLCLEKNSRKLCHVSSVAAINHSLNGLNLDENSSWTDSSQESPYAISKYLSELEVWRGIAEGLKAVIVNPSFILGPGNGGRSSTRIFNYIWDKKPYYTNGGTGFVDVRDVVDSMLILMESDTASKRYIVNGTNATFKELFDIIALNFNLPKPSIRVSPFFSSIAWRVEWLRSLLTGKEPFITRTSAYIAQKKRFFSNENFCRDFDFRFRDLSETVEWACRELQPILS